MCKTLSYSNPILEFQELREPLKDQAYYQQFCLFIIRMSFGCLITPNKEFMRSHVHLLSQLSLVLEGLLVALQI